MPPAIRHVCVRERAAALGPILSRPPAPRHLTLDTRNDDHSGRSLLHLQPAATLGPRYLGETESSVDRVFLGVFMESCSTELTTTHTYDLVTLGRCFLPDSRAKS